MSVESVPSEEDSLCCEEFVKQVDFKPGMKELWMTTVVNQQVHKGYCAVFFRIGLSIGGMRWISVVDAPSINAFKQTLVKVRNNRMGFFMEQFSKL